MRALVAGLGRMGTLHRKVLRDLGYDVVTADPVHHGADFKTVAEVRMQDFQWARTRNQVSVAVVAVPIPQLVDVAFQLSGIKKLLIEKPFAPTVQDALMLASYLKDCGSDVGVGYVERFNPVVRDLRERIFENGRVRAARFIRHNARPSGDHELDLLIHDVDLASYLRLWRVDPTFDVKSDNTEHVRRIEVDVHAGPETRDGPVETLVADLMDHELSPLHAMWHAFLTSGEDVARPQDAVRALEYARRITELEGARA